MAEYSSVRELHTEKMVIHSARDMRAGVGGRGWASVCEPALSSQNACVSLFKAWSLLFSNTIK